MKWFRIQNLAEAGPELGQWKLRKPTWLYGIKAISPDLKRREDQLILFTADQLDELKQIVAAIEDDLDQLMLDELAVEEKELLMKIQELRG